MVIDLHTHTNFSDGTDTPTELINKALAAGIKVIGLTDHDSTGGWQEAAAALLQAHRRLISCCNWVLVPGIAWRLERA
jgi:predicted metal-dependent phosphoesterase TrpH